MVPSAIITPKTIEIATMPGYGMILYLRGGWCTVIVIVVDTVVAVAVGYWCLGPSHLTHYDMSINNYCNIAIPIFNYNLQEAVDSIPVDT